MMGVDTLTAHRSNDNPNRNHANRIQNNSWSKEIQTNFEFIIFFVVGLLFYDGGGQVTGTALEPKF
jgi:hypothetical protein